MSRIEELQYRYKEGIPLLSWNDVKLIIETNQLHLLGRSKEQQVVYDNFRETIISQWLTTRDYILVTKFNYNQSIVNNKYFAVKQEDRLLPQFKLIENDFPYNFENNIRHLILWKNDSHEVNLEDINKYAEVYVSSNSNIIEWTYYINPIHLKSLPDIDHAHLLFLVKSE